MIARGPDFPIEAGYLWAAFNELDLTRHGGMGPGAISYIELAGYAFVHGFRWKPFEIAVIRALDREYLIFQAEQAKQKEA